MRMTGVLMEIQDSNYFLLENVSIGTSPTGFMDADVAVLLGKYLIALICDSIHN
jgi:hypothetical protein